MKKSYKIFSLFFVLIILCPILFFTFSYWVLPKIIISKLHQFGYDLQGLDNVQVGLTGISTQTIIIRKDFVEKKVRFTIETLRINYSLLNIISDTEFTIILPKVNITDEGNGAIESTLVELLDAQVIVTLKGKIISLQGKSQLKSPQINTGEISADFTSSLPDNKSQSRLLLDLTNLNGKTEWFSFQDLSGNFHLDPDKKFSTISTANVNAKEIVAGVRFANVKGALSFDLVKKDPIVKFEIKSANVFGGTIKSRPANYQLGTNTVIPISFSKFDLAKILELYNQESIIGTGILSGSIPIKISSKGISVTNGSLSAEPPGGVLKYSSPALNSEESYKFALNALRNFHYRTLTAKVDYNDIGKLFLNLNLQGENPDLNSNQPLNVNLTVEEDIPDLIQSLQLTGSIEEGIQNTLRK